MLVVLFYWLSFCFTVWAWFKFIISLCELNFIRASLWWNAVWMLFWWFDKPRSWEDFGPEACFFVGLGALGTFVRYYRKRNTNRNEKAIPSSVIIYPDVRLLTKDDWVLQGQSEGAYWTDDMLEQRHPHAGMG
jgi:hypothetical protein